MTAETLSPPRPRVPQRLVVVGLLLAYLAALAGGWWTAMHVLPQEASVTALGHTIGLAQVYRRLAGDAALIFLILPAAYWIEWLVVGWDRSSIRRLMVDRSASIRTDIAYFIAGEAHLTGLLGKLMTFGASMLSGVWMHDWLQAHTGLAVDLAAWPMAVQVLVYFYVYSFFDYWTHRLDHTRYFWPLHRFHHAADEFCVVTSARTHPAAFSAIFLINFPMAILGATPEVMVYVNVVVISLGFLIHSRIDSTFGWVGRWIVQSPNHHRLHHQLDWTTVKTGHYAMAPVWDHLFGTWRGDCDQTLVIGVDTPYRHGWWIGRDLVRDYWDFLRGIGGAIAALPRAVGRLGA